MILARLHAMASPESVLARVANIDKRCFRKSNSVLARKPSLVYYATIWINAIFLCDRSIHWNIQGHDGTSKQATSYLYIQNKSIISEWITKHRYKRASVHIYVYTGRYLKSPRKCVIHNIKAARESSYEFEDAYVNVFWKILEDPFIGPVRVISIWFSLQDIYNLYLFILLSLD